MTKRKRRVDASFGNIREFGSLQLEGAVKVCVRYGKKTPEGLTRCLQWTPGPGYAEGPVPRGTATVPKYFIQEARVREDGTKITRPYRYRGGKKPLPYPPRTTRGKGGVTEGPFNPISIRTQAKWDDLPEPVRLKVIDIIGGGAVEPLTAQELLLLGQGSSDSES